MKILLFFVNPTSSIARLSLASFSMKPVFFLTVVYYLLYIHEVDSTPYGHSRTCSIIYCLQIILINSFLVSYFSTRDSRVKAYLLHTMEEN